MSLSAVLLLLELLQELLHHHWIMGRATISIFCLVKLGVHTFSLVAELTEGIGKRQVLTLAALELEII